MASWLDEIAHLQPPTLSAVRVTRFSPYHARPQQYGIAIEPSQCYRYIFPLHGDDLSRFARYFEVEPAEPADLDALDALGELRTRVHDWNARWRSDGASPPKLAATDEHCRQIVDTRPCAVAAEHALDEVEAALLRACESGLRPQRAVAAASASAPEI